MIGPRVAAAVLRKDLLLDLRSRDRLGHMVVFAFLVVVTLSLPLPPAASAAREMWTPTLLWVVFLFTSVLGLGRSFQAETEGGAISTLAQVPCDRGWVFLGKAAANLIALFGVGVWTAVLFAVFLEVEWDRAPIQALGIGVLGAAGLSVLGTLLASMSASARFREFLLPVLLYPLTAPILVVASKATASAIERGTVDGMHWGVLALYDWVFLLVGYFVFDFVLEE